MATGNVPIVFFHYGDGGYYLPVALRAARLFNAGTRVFLLGDGENKDLAQSNGVIWEQWQKYDYGEEYRPDNQPFRTPSDDPSGD